MVKLAKYHGYTGVTLLWQNIINLLVPPLISECTGLSSPRTPRVISETLRIGFIILIQLGWLEVFPRIAMVVHDSGMALSRRDIVQLDSKGF